MTLKELTFDREGGFGGEQALVEFDNGYGASVLRGGMSYTSGGTYELAVIHGDKICYQTPVTDDVIGYADEEEINTALAAIEALPVNSACTHGRKSNWLSRLQTKSQEGGE